MGAVDLGWRRLLVLGVVLELADVGAESRLLLGEVVAVLEHGVGRGHAVVHCVAVRRSTEVVGASV